MTNKTFNDVLLEVLNYTNTGEKPPVRNIDTPSRGAIPIDYNPLMMDDMSEIKYSGTSGKFTFNDMMAFLKEVEGLKTDAYEDVAGVPTIGYGSTAGVNMGDSLSERDAERLLEKELVEFTKAYDRLVDVDLNPKQKAAVTSLIFNVGEGAFAKSKARKALNAGDFDTFLVEAFDPDRGFTKAEDPETKKKRKVDGLVNRRMKERDLFLS
jgi:lysozyme